MVVTPKMDTLVRALNFIAVFNHIGKGSNPYQTCIAFYIPIERIFLSTFLHDSTGTEANLLNSDTDSKTTL